MIDRPGPDDIEPQRSAGDLFAFLQIAGERIGNMSSTGDKRYDGVEAIRLSSNDDRAHLVLTAVMENGTPAIRIRMTVD